MVEGKCSHPVALPIFGERPSAGICRACEHYDGPSRGLGDTVHRLAKATGVARVVKSVVGECGCQKRREALNDAFPAASDNCSVKK